MRIMRLGTVWHDDMEKALRNLPKDQYWMYNLKEIYFENEIVLEDFNVRGHYDALFVTLDDEYLLYDFKTIGSFPWRLKFGKHAEKEEVNIKHELQVATYGLAIKRQYGRIDGLYLLYYNKDNSSLREITVPLSRIDDAIEYWTSINEEHKKGLPEINLGISPVEKWECNYCDWHTLCNPQL
jgi:CRISPR/Cas system-associated exonuclease Cas4 (RecB family)